MNSSFFFPPHRQIKSAIKLHLEGVNPLFFSGEKLLRGDKYAMSEIAISEYAYQLNMTIRRLEKSDFGSYMCSSENTFGKADGVVRLRGQHSPPIFSRSIKLDSAEFCNDLLTFQNCNWSRRRSRLSVRTSSSVSLVKSQRRHG